MSCKGSGGVEKVRDEINKRQRVVNRGRAGVERRKDICAGRGTKGRSDTTASRYRRRRTRRQIENDRVGGKELLVAGDDEGGGEVCKRV